MMAELKPADTASVRDQVSEDEWKIRVNLAACYRLIAHNGWDDLVYTHISARVPGTDDHFLLNPMGLMFEEVTASSLVKIDLDGRKVMDSPYDVNAAGFVIHSAIHEARPDIGCIIHLHTDYGVAVSMQKDGLLPISQTATFPYSFLTYHDYEGVAVRDDEKQRLVANLGNKFLMILRNHGTISCGPDIGFAYIGMHFLEKACKIQILAQSSGQELIPIEKEAYENALAGGDVVNAAFTPENSPWTALLRKMDRLDPSYKT